MNLFKPKKEMKLLIVGGAGAFGSFYAKLFKEYGFTVFISSKVFQNAINNAKKIKVTPVEKPVYSDYDYICLSVPNENAVELAKKIIPNMKKESLFFDFCSVKEQICNELNKHKKIGIELVSIHPMHGPRINGIKHQPIAWIDINVNLGKKAELLMDFFKKREAKIILTTPKKHDTTLSIVQGLTHYTMFVSSSVLKESKQNIQETILLASPNYKLFLMDMSRIILQNPSLYAQIQLTNPYNSKIRKLFTSEAKKLENICAKNDQKKLVKKIIENGKYLKNNNSLLEESDRAVQATS